MIKKIMICQYCDYHTTLIIKVSKCPKCGDRNLKFKDIDKGNVFGYDLEEEKIDFDSKKIVSWDEDDDYNVNGD